LGNSSYEALQTQLQRAFRSGLFLKLNYSWSHAINEDSQGGRAGYAAECRLRFVRQGIAPPTSVMPLCERHLCFALRRSSRWGGWSLSGVNSFHTGLPLNVTVTRKATAAPDGNTTNQRPNYVYGAPLIPAGARISTTGSILPHSPRRPTARGKCGRDIVDGPNLFQVDTALQKDTRLSERMGSFSVSTCSTSSIIRSWAARI